MSTNRTRQGTKQEMLQAATAQWIRLVREEADGTCYWEYASPEQAEAFGEPTWPDQPFDALLQQAMGRIEYAREVWPHQRSGTCAACGRAVTEDEWDHDAVAITPPAGKVSQLMHLPCLRQRLRRK